MPDSPPSRIPDRTAPAAIDGYRTYTERTFLCTQDVSSPRIIVTPDDIAFVENGDAVDGNKRFLTSDELEALGYAALAAVAYYRGELVPEADAANSS